MNYTVPKAPISLRDLTKLFQELVLIREHIDDDECGSEDPWRIFLGKLEEAQIVRIETAFYNCKCSIHTEEVDAMIAFAEETAAIFAGALRQLEEHLKNSLEVWRHQQERYFDEEV